MAGLYIHVPFCQTPHVYDDSVAVPIDDADPSAYVSALCRELHTHAQTYATQAPIRTVYAGGGRPSLLALESVQSILATMIDVFDVSAVEEASAELHPADATSSYVRGLRRLGFDRIHLPILSFFPDDLRALDAPHTVEDAINALRLAREAFDRVSVDLFFGWPQQSPALWRAVLNLAAELEIEHITVVEAPPNGAPTADADARADRLEFAMSFLQSEGYQQYELAHFARPGARSAHQELYYSHSNYLGLGPSAESFWWTDRDATAMGRRWSNVSALDEYVALLDTGESPVAYRETLDAPALAHEYLLLRLRTDEGVDGDLLSDRYGFDIRHERSALLACLRNDGLLHPDPQALRLTNRGRLVADAIASRLRPSR